MSLLAAAKASPATWDAWACLAMASAAAVGAVNFLTDYQKQAGWSELGRVVRGFKRQLLGLALLEALAGLAVTFIVTALGVTKPPWLDEPIGWLLLGAVGPAIAAASIATLKVGTADVKLGLSLIYEPAKDLLLEPIDNAFFMASRSYSREKEAVYRGMFAKRFDSGDLTLDQATKTLRDFSERPRRAIEDKRAIADQLKFVDQSSPPAGVDARDWERSQLSTLVAFMVERRYFAVLDALVGEPTDADRKAVTAPVAPPGAAS